MITEDQVLTKWVCPNCTKGFLVISAYSKPGKIKLVCNRCGTIILGDIDMYLPGNSFRKTNKNWWSM